MIIEPRMLGCPNCKTKYIDFRTLSSNTFGAKLWTDGVLRGDMTGDYPSLLKCRICHHCYLQKDEKRYNEKGLTEKYVEYTKYIKTRSQKSLKSRLEIESDPEYINFSENYHKPKPITIQGLDLKTPIQNNCMNNIEDEIIIRIAYWHTRNDIERNFIENSTRYDLIKPHYERLSKIDTVFLVDELKKIDTRLSLYYYYQIKDLELTKEFNIENLKQLVKIIDKTHPLYLLTAEMYRHLKQFDKSIEIIQNYYHRYDKLLFDISSHNDQAKSILQETEGMSGYDLDNTSKMLRKLNRTMDRNSQMLDMSMRDLIKQLKKKNVVLDKILELSEQKNMDLAVVETK